MRLRVGKRFVWYPASASVALVGALASWFILDPPVEQSRPSTDTVRPAPAPTPHSPLRSEVKPDAGFAAVRSAKVDRVAALERTIRDRSLPAAKRESALRRLVVRYPAAGQRAALELVRAREQGSLEREAARALAHGDRSAFRELLELLLRTPDVETALACGTAFDAWAPLDATDVSRALTCAALPEARVVLVRALAQATPPDVAQVAIEQSLRCDPWPQVKAEALAALDASQLDRLTPVIVGDAALRRAASRALAHVPGGEVDRILEEAFRAESNDEVLTDIAQSLACRSEEGRTALLEIARVTPERSAIANSVLASLDRSRRGRAP